MKKIGAIFALILAVVTVFSAFPASAADEYLTVQNFKEIYPDANLAAEISEASNGAQISFKKIDSRVTLVGTGEDPGDDEWGRLMKFDGLVMEFSGVNFPKPTSRTNGVTLAFTFSQEAGSFYATGSTGVHIRIFYTVDGMSIYMKSAPAADTAAYYPMTGISWERFPSKLTVKMYKSGDEYIFLFNEVECRVAADKIEADLSRSGMCFVNIGIMGIQNPRNPATLIVNKIYNDPTLGKEEETTSKPVTSTPEESKPVVSTPVESTPEESEPESSAPVESTPEEDTSSAPALTGPSSMNADPDKAVIDGANMTIKALKGLTVAEFAAAFTIDEGYEIAVFDADGTRLEGTAAIESGKTVKVMGGEQSFAEFTLAFMDAAAGENNG
ncbi:MAG: hypothetical protein E7486_04105, partial [Ruminococcaceae bacterium]|nr:hypothetical protein [Oscillospiraceae bacterium]